MTEPNYMEPEIMWLIVAEARRLLTNSPGWTDDHETAMWVDHVDHYVFDHDVPVSAQGAYSDE